MSSPSGQLSAEGVINGKLVLQDSLKGQITPEGKISGKLSVFGRYPYYPGPYIVTPDVNEQTLDTVHTSMREDVVIEPVPYHEVPNDFGLTVSICS